MKSKHWKWLAAGSVALVAGASSASADSFNLGSADGYAVLGIQGDTTTSKYGIEVYAGSVVNGNVGAGPNEVWTHTMDATIKGLINEDPTVTPPTVTGTVSGGIHSTSMTSVPTDALTASSLIAAMAPTKTLSGLNSGDTITGTGGTNVIRITGDVSLNGGSTTLNISGSASDIFIFQLTASDATSATTLDLQGVTMHLTGGVTADNILWDLNGAGGGVVISSSANVDGYFLAPDRSILVDNAIVTGSVIGGGGADSHSNTVSVHSSSQITFPSSSPFVSTVPLPSAAQGGLLLLGGAGVLGLVRRRSLRA